MGVLGLVYVIDVACNDSVIHTFNFAQVQSMDDNCGEWVECMGVASGSGWNLWVWLLGVVLRRYIDFLILLIPTPLVSVLFCSSIPTSFFILLIIVTTRWGSLRLTQQLKRFNCIHKIASWTRPSFTFFLRTQFLNGCT